MRPDEKLTRLWNWNRRFVLVSIVLDEPARFFKLRFAKRIRIRRRAFSRCVLRPYPNLRSKKSTQRGKGEEEG
ncbi:MAG: hypothetical protein DMF11_13285 [Verrucomicrobia bacterium]|nr:MAG: hypothetical protein DMF11_13285 [Verrucomicrobiota bacterium]